jgi:hypothetical protein
VGRLREATGRVEGSPGSAGPFQRGDASGSPLGAMLQKPRREESDTVLRIGGHRLGIAPLPLKPSLPHGGPILPLARTLRQLARAAASGAGFVVWPIAWHRLPGGSYGGGIEHPPARAMAAPILSTLATILHNPPAHNAIVISPSFSQPPCNVSTQSTSRPIENASQ